MPRGAAEVQMDGLLTALEGAMINASLWTSASPSSWALDSTAPFACDRMPFERWLQFMFIPKIKGLMTQGLPQPMDIALYPMAQESFAKPSAEVMTIILKIDKHLSGQPR